ncbi:MAG TPA: DUF4258 domain-containing protein [Chloroflexota bacterium]|nr:DUF4258 domain-containing protein [Chloroflexota bacterium]
MDLSRHAQEELARRGIALDWVWRAVQTPDATEQRPDGTIHYIKRLPQQGGRYLRIVVNHRKQPPRVATIFFDARLRRQQRRARAQRNATPPHADTR